MGRPLVKSRRFYDATHSAIHICHSNYLSTFKINVQTAQFNVGTVLLLLSLRREMQLQDTLNTVIYAEKMFDCWYKQPSNRARWMRASSVADLDPYACSIQ